MILFDAVFAVNPSNDVQEIEERRDDSSRTADEIHERRRGSATRKSYTLEFKKQTLHLLDSLSNSRNKWKKVAEAKQISKCLVIKWNKARDKIFVELSLNKCSANAGGVRASRQRRKMVGEKAKNSERYPHATKLLVAEFKLRRAQGSKNSKLWMKSKMKKKIEMGYGKEAADKFKASDNWFQRFKQRNNVSLRCRTNKKQHSADAAREKILEFHRNLRKAVKSKRRRSKLFQTGNMDNGCQNKGSMSTKSLFLLLLNRTGHMIFQEASRSDKMGW